MTTVSVEELFGGLRERVESGLETYLPAGGTVPEIVEAMRYSLLAGGKRLRPAMALATSEMLGGDLANVLPAACALEMIHTYSLIHDDLPCMDDDDLRRGRPTCHVKFGEDMAVLAGDGLSNAAFLLIARETRDKDLVASLVEELATAAGTDGMIGGQVLDMKHMGGAPDLEVVREIHARKTGALIVASVRLGALAARADAEVLERVTRYGRLVGEAFQIVDDVLDVTADDATLGKSAGKDVEQGKMTFPACIGVEASREEALRLAAEGIAAIEGLDGRGRLTGFARYVCSRVH
ncbi:MAG: polyprenyl synthetase family protein [Planctomycetota bacterium]